MLKVKLEFRNVGCEEVVKLLTRFRKAFPFGYKVWLDNSKVFALFMLESASDLRDLIKRLKRMNARFKFHQIVKVRICRMKEQPMC
jgi:hypothetical protein